MFKTSRLINVMGVSGCGKSTIGARLGVALNVPFLDGDHYHSKEAVEKMHAGIPLTDDDRWPWLDRLVAAMIEAADRNGHVVAASSALKRSYRDYMTKAAGEPIAFVHLYAPQSVIAQRQADRPGHFMPASLLDSQYQTLEMPQSDENATTIDVSGSLDQTMERAARALGLETHPTPKG